MSLYTGTIWYDTTAVRPGYDRPIVHIVYFWMYTLTTVGFSTPIDLKSELQHVYQLLLLRIFGLAFLAGVVDSVVVYVEYRKELYVNKTFNDASNGLAVEEYDEDEEEDEVFEGRF